MVAVSSDVGFLKSAKPGGAGPPDQSTRMSKGVLLVAAKKLSAGVPSTVLSDVVVAFGVPILKG